MLYHDPLSKTVGEMRTLARSLIPYSFPIKTHEDEADIAILKKRETTLDGYEIVVFFNNADYGDKTLETLQVFGAHFTFLPFYLVCKVARAFLGDEKLSLVEIMHSSTGETDKSCRKIYAWTLYYDVQGNKIDGPFAKNAVLDSYGGWQFSRIPNKDVKFF